MVFLHQVAEVSTEPRSRRPVVAGVLHQASVAPDTLQHLLRGAGGLAPTSPRCPSTTVLTLMLISVREFWVLHGQLADLLGHHGEALARFPGVGGLDGGVQGQQVGLVGDLGQDAQHFVDALGLLAEGLHAGGELGLLAALA